MDENIAIRISGLSKKYSISEKKTDLSFAGKLKELFHFSNHIKVKKPDYFYALKNINLEIKKGESVGIIGRNGAGKSTLLKILAEVAEPTEGTIEINGTIASVLEVGMGFHPELTGRENVYLSGTMLGIPKKKIVEKFDEIVEFSGVQKFIDTPVKHYSSGMYVRLAFSVVTNIDADILLFDEVLSVGDLAFQMKCVEKIQELIEQKKTVLLVSHNMNDIQNLCRKVVYMDKGSLEKSGSINVVKDYFEESYEDQAINVETPAYKESKKHFTNIIYKEWSSAEAPGDDSIKLKKFYVKNISTPDSDNFYTDDNIAICFEYEKLDNNNFFDLGFIIMSMNNMLIGCHTLHSDIDITKKTEQGLYIATAIFNKDFFNETIIDVGCSISKTNQTLVFFELNVLRIKFNLRIKEHEKEYFNNLSKFLGPLRPKIEWQINKYD